MVNCGRSRGCRDRSAAGIWEGSGDGSDGAWRGALTRCGADVCRMTWRCGGDEAPGDG